MKPLFRLLLPAVIGLASLPASEIPTTAPRKVNSSQYTLLWTKSPFTTPPPPIVVEPGPGEFDELALRGIAQISPGHYLITLADKKHPEDTQVIDTERDPEYKVLKVERNPDEALGTVVTLKKGSFTGTVSYDEKISSAPKTATPVVKPGQKPQIPGQPPGPTLPQPNLPPGVHQPRMRVVPPPTTTPTTGAPGAVPRSIPGVQPPGGSSRGIPSGGSSRGGSSGGRPDFRGNHSSSRAPRR
jgi:hypothetical protein